MSQRSRARNSKLRVRQSREQEFRATDQNGQGTRRFPAARCSAVAGPRQAPRAGGGRENTRRTHEACPACVSVAPLGGGTAGGSVLRGGSGGWIESHLRSRRGSPGGPDAGIGVHRRGEPAFTYVARTVRAGKRNRAEGGGDAVRPGPEIRTAILWYESVAGHVRIANSRPPHDTGLGSFGVAYSGALRRI